MTMSDKDEVAFGASPWLKRFCEDHAVILGSSSKWRRKVLTQAGCRTVDALDPAIDEKAIRKPSAEELVLAISNAKADALMVRIDREGMSESFLICTDQVALCDGEIREKPESEAQAREYIHSYSEEGKPVETCSGVVVVDVLSGHREQGVHYNKVYFNRIPPSSVDEIVGGDVVYTCCGGFSVDWPVMSKFVSSISGGTDGVMGMPLGLLEELFKRHQQRRVSSH
jgi:septum formation protein